MLDICLLVGFKNKNFDRDVLDLLKLVTALLGCRLCWHYVTLKTLHMRNCNVPQASLYVQHLCGCAIIKSSCLRSPAYNSHMCFIALDDIAQAHVVNSLHHGVIHTAFEARAHQPQS